MLDSGCSQHMTGDSRMFNSLKSNDSGIDSITFCDNSKGNVKALGRITISNDHSISNVLLDEKVELQSSLGCSIV